MRIVIDLQGAQTTGSRNRGIGRYSNAISQAMVRNKHDHEVLIALSGLFPDSIESIRTEFGKILPQDNIRVWHAPGPVSHLIPTNSWRRKTAELVHEAFLASLNPDFIYLSSLFEGLGDDAVTSVARLTTTIPTAVTLFDLIPLINRKHYLDNPAVESWYEYKLDDLRRADLLLAISESSRLEGINWLGFSHERAVNVGTAADPQFKQIIVSGKTEQDIRKRYGLSKPFVMYTGGIDYRKNVEGLIRAFALLPKSLRGSHQLSIVCSVNQHARALLEKLVADHGMSKDDVVLTGFVPEEDLIVLYHLCRIFIFPSWHEGFGLPALEAMSCGAPVIAANTSSLPEVVGRDDALFDPHDDRAIAAKLQQTLTQDAYRNELIQHGIEQAAKFSWDTCAQRAIAAMERVHGEKQTKQSAFCLSFRRPKLAYVSPLPPERSGISDYSKELLPELSRHYDIDLIVDQKTVSDPWCNENCTTHNASWLLENANKYDRVLYHFGNSHFHKHMIELLTRIPGVIVLHDFFLSGLAAYVSHQKWESGMVGAFESELYNNHGYEALLDFSKTRDVPDAIMKYPCSKTVIDAALGVIVHSENSRQMPTKWFGECSNASWAVIPSLRVPVTKYTRLTARNLLKIPEAAFLVCSFGLVGPTKLNHRLLHAWMASSLGKDKNCMLVYVGENNGAEYGDKLLEEIQNSSAANRIHITGWLDASKYHQYLAATDIGVQLRTHSRGETSAAVLDCMNYGLPMIVNANGSMADLTTGVVWMLPDEFDDAELVRALDALYDDPQARADLGRKAREMIVTNHSPRKCAGMYAVAIEHYHKKAQSGQTGLIRAIVGIEDAAEDEREWIKLAKTLALNKQPPFLRQLLIDITGLITNDSHDRLHSIRSYLRRLVTDTPQGVRVEPVYASSEGYGYRYARQFMARVLECSHQMFTDDIVEAYSGDIFIGLQPQISKQQIVFFQQMRISGGEVYFAVDDSFPVIHGDSTDEGSGYKDNIWQKAVALADGLICTTESVANKMASWLSVAGPKRLRPLTIRLISRCSNFSTVNSESEICFSSQDILDAISAQATFLDWMPDHVLRYWGSDFRLNTQVGQHAGRTIISTGRQGFLIYGPYVPLAAGHYQIEIHGALGASGAGGAYVDVTSGKGCHHLGKSSISTPVKDNILASFRISLESPCDELEIRVWVESETTLKVAMLQIIPTTVLDEKSSRDVSIHLNDLGALATPTAAMKPHGAGSKPVEVTAPNPASIRKNHRQNKHKQRKNKCK